MFNLSVFLLLFGLAIIANLIAIPKMVSLTNAHITGNERKILMISSLSNNLLLSIGAAAVGSYMAPRVSISSPLLESLVTLDQPHAILLQLLPPISLNSVYALLGILLIQVFLMNRCFTLPNHFHIPTSVRVLKEGVIEEIIFRWGLLPLTARILWVEFSVNQETAILIAIFLSALGSSISHISDLYRLNFQRLPLAILSVTLVNFWGGIVYGWLLCKYGLATAILCHSVVILISSITYEVMCFFAISDRNY